MTETAYHNDPTLDPMVSNLLPPTSALPNIKELRATSLATLQKAVDYLRLLYLPEVRGSQRRNGPHRGLNEAESNIQTIRSDAFERAYAIRWLTVLNKALTERDVNSDEHDNEEDVESQQKLIDKAASLLACCSGASATGTISRQFTFSPLEEENHCPVSVILIDAPLVNADYGTVGAQTWGGACVLSEMLVEEPASFGLISPPGERPLRILELGSGTGLVGLTISKLFAQLASSPELDHGRSTATTTKVEIVLTDFHPVVLENLCRNVEANFGTSNTRGEELQRLEVDVSVKRLDWEAVYQFRKGDQEAGLLDFGGAFDLVFGADIIYEAGHALWIRACLEKLLAPSPSSCFHLVIPLRSTHTKESSTIEETFPRPGSQSQVTDPIFANRNLVILSEEKSICDALPDSGAGRTVYDGTDEVVYMYYKIGWGGFPSS